jgi:hypothetical protein
MFDMPAIDQTDKDDLEELCRDHSTRPKQVFQGLAGTDDDDDTTSFVVTVRERPEWCIFFTKAAVERTTFLPQPRNVANLGSKDHIA